MKRRAAWLGLGIALLIFGAWLMPSIDPRAGNPSVDSDELAFPRWASVEDYERMRTRRTWAVPVAAVPDAGADAGARPQEQLRDPLLLALPPRADLVVFEASAFLRSPIGRMFAACLDEEGDAPTLEREGFDLHTFERVAIGNPMSDDRVVVLAGNVQGRLPKLLDGVEPEAYGEHAQLYRRGGPELVVRWNDQLLLVSDSESELLAAIDRLEGRSAERSTFPPDQAYGEVYGRLGAEALRRVLGSELRDRLPQTDLEMEVHADAQRDVLLVADAYGDANAMDIGKLLAAALGAQRFAAVAEGDDDLAQLLDAFSVEQAEDGFRLQAAFTQSFVAEMLGECATRARQQHEGAEGNDGAAGTGG